MDSDKQDFDNSPGECPSEEDLVQYVLEPEMLAGSHAIRDHAAECPRCCEVLADVRATVGLIEVGDVAQAGCDLVPVVLDRIENCNSKGRRNYFARFWKPLRLAAEILIILACAFAAIKFAGWGSGQSDAIVAVQGVDRALDSGAEWLIRKQGEDGGWNVAELGGDPSFGPALNGLAILALTHSAPDSEKIQAALGPATVFLLQSQSEAGRFGSVFDRTMYNHGIATLALLKAYEISGDAKLEESIERALAFTASKQNPTGGWGYQGLQTSAPNTSVTAWQLQSLLLADRLGWRDNSDEIGKALAWLGGNVNNRGFFSYGSSGIDSELAEKETLTMMGAYCVLTALHMDFPVDPTLKDRVLKGMDKLAGDQPDDYYGAYFYSSALAELGEQAFGQALGKVQATLLNNQQSQGEEGGCWLADDRWGSVGGRVYSTSMSLMALRGDNVRR